MNNTYKDSKVSFTFNAKCDFVIHISYFYVKKLVFCDLNSTAFSYTFKVNISFIITPVNSF